MNAVIEADAAKAIDTALAAAVADGVAPARQLLSASGTSGLDHNDVLFVRSRVDRTIYALSRVLELVPDVSSEIE